MKNSNRLWILSICLIVSFLGCSDLFANEPESNSVEAAAATKYEYVIFINSPGKQNIRQVEVDIRKELDWRDVPFSGMITYNPGPQPASLLLEPNTTYNMQIAYTAGTVSHVHVQDAVVTGSGLNWKFTTGNGHGYIYVSYSY